MATSRQNLRPALELIESRCAEALDVPALARSVRLSTAHFSREFKRAFGESPHQYLIGCRMQRAAELLRSSDGMIDEVCKAVGLRSVGSFTTRFGQTFGISPGAYRQAHRPSRPSRMS